MGMIIDKASITGFFGGVTITKDGVSYLAVISKGPKVDKFRLPKHIQVDGTAQFCAPVVVELTGIEQKFSDFNNSFSEVATAKILKDVK